MFLGELIWQAAVQNTFIRGSVIRYINLPAASVDTTLLQDATRTENAPKVAR
jgi:hypothetical protein